MQMHLPEFFAASPRLRVFDPLADFLGAAQDGDRDRPWHRPSC